MRKPRWWRVVLERRGGVPLAGREPLDARERLAARASSSSARAARPGRGRRRRCSPCRATRRSYPSGPCRHADVVRADARVRRGRVRHVPRWRHGRPRDHDRPTLRSPRRPARGRARRRQRPVRRGADRHGDPHQRAACSSSTCATWPSSTPPRSTCCCAPARSSAGSTGRSCSSARRAGAARVRAGRVSDLFTLFPSRAAAAATRSCHLTDRLSCRGWPFPSCSTAIPGTTTRSRSCSPPGTRHRPARDHHGGRQRAARQGHAQRPRRGHARRARRRPDRRRRRGPAAGELEFATDVHGESALDGPRCPSRRSRSTRARRAR